MANRNKATYLFPMPHLVHPLYHAPTIPFTRNLGKFLNRFLFNLVNFFTAKYLLKFTKDYHSKFPNIKLSNKTVRQFMLKDANSIFMISQQFFKKPTYWGDNLHVLGYRERNKTINWEAEKSLLDFIEKYDKIFFITFGSMTNPYPEKHTQTTLSILRKHKIPTIINTFSGGLMKLENNDNHIIFVKRIPYDWIFEKCYAIMHHGGSGTLHMATKYNCPSLIIPHAMDQFFWKQKTADLGLGPLGIPIKKMKTTSLEPKIIEILNNKSYKKTAIRMGEEIRKEDYEKELLEVLDLR